MNRVVQVDRQMHHGSFVVGIVHLWMDTHIEILTFLGDLNHRLSDIVTQKERPDPAKKQYDG